jgi:hypothetical protein
VLVFARIDHQRNTDAGERLKVTDIVKETQGYQQNWKNHLEGDCFPQLVFFHRSGLGMTNMIMERPRPSGIQ